MISAVSLDHRKLKLQKASRFATKKQHATEIIRSYILQFTAQSIPSVPFPPPTGICHFVLENWSCKYPMVGPGGSYKNSTVGLNNWVQLPHPETTPKLHFPVNKLQIPYLRKICNNLIKLAREAPYDWRKPLLAACYNYCKKDHIDLINLNDRTLN